jgi:glycosyltransferase involved in cell wall biosynthesis
MKILQICPIFSTHPKEVGSGVTQVVYNISKELSKRGHDVEVYTSNALDMEKRIGNKSSSAIVDGIKVSFFPYKVQYYTFFLTPAITPAVKRHLKEFDIVHIHDQRAFQSIVVYHYAKLYRIPYVLQAHGSLCPTVGRKKLKRIYDSSLGYRLLRDASKVVALNLTEAQQYGSMGITEEKIRVIPNGIDLDQYSELPPHGSFKKKFNIPDNKRIVLYLGRIHRIKGIDFAVRAFAILAKELEDIRLVIVGPDDGYLEELKVLIKVLKIENEVSVIGPLYGRSKLEAYVDADVYVLPSRYEIFPLSILEAYACGKPVIASNISGLRDLVVDGKTGFLAEQGNVEQLARCMLTLVEDHGRAEEMGFSGKLFVKQKFPMENIVDSLEDLYTEIVRVSS